MPWACRRLRDREDDGKEAEEERRGASEVGQVGEEGLGSETEVAWDVDVALGCKNVTSDDSIHDKLSATASSAEAQLA